MRPVAHEVAAAVDACDAELVYPRERSLQRGQIAVDVGDNRDTVVGAHLGRASYPLTPVNSIDTLESMTVDLELVPKHKRPAGEPCCEPVVYPDVERAQAIRMAEVAKALGDPIRLQLVDVLRKHAGQVCVCELVPLFDVSQPTLSHHLKKLRDAGIVDSERRGLWAYYYVRPDALKELSSWLT
jgi:ArsR family transcriptional regulator, arsenate/arsenite/antimonite-responsive transcriptional repressor